MAHATGQYQKRKTQQILPFVVVVGALVVVAVVVAVPVRNCC